LLPGTSRPLAMAMTTAVGVLPALASALAVPQVLAVLLAAAVAAAMLAVVVLRHSLLGITPAVAAIFSAVSAVSAVVAVTVAFDGYVEGPVFLALALVVAVAGRRSTIARWAATAFTAVGALIHLSYTPPGHLAVATSLSTAEAVSVLASSVLLTACAVVLCRGATVLAAVAVAVGVYTVTTFTVTLGVLVGGTGGGFLAGHMAATICWTGMAAVLFGYAQRVGDREARTAPISAGLALTAAATTKLLLFDLGTLDGMFRVVVFIVVGLVLLAMGAGYARSLAQPTHSKGMPHQS